VRRANLIAMRAIGSRQEPAKGMSDGNGESPRSWLERVSDLFSAEPTSVSELMETLRDAAERNLIDADALNIIFGAIAVSDMQVRDVMIPRSQLVTVSASSRPNEFLPTIIESGHSRFPVIGDDVDDVRGILHAKDMLPLLLNRDWDDFDIKDCMRASPVVPESKRLNVLLQEFRANRNHMAVVIDEYGHVSGAVTIEDVLEQIVGEIEDEYDVDEAGMIKEIAPRVFNIKATTAIEDFNEYFGTSFSDEEVDTIGGLVLRELGHLPKRGESARVDDFEFRILNADSRRIRLMQMTRTGAAR
jgi:magnesium and cobalt transporter